MAPAGLGRIPLLGQAGLSRYFDDPQLWAEQLNAFTPSHICEPTARQGPFSNCMAMLPLGCMRILSTLGNSIQLASSGSGYAHLVMSYRGLTRWCVDRQWFDNWTNESLLYVPPGPLQIENSITAGIVTFVDLDALLQTALTMEGPDGNHRMVKGALQSTRLIPAQDPSSRKLFRVLYSAYRHLDCLSTAGSEVLRQSCMEDQILRLWILLLIPELRVGAGRSSRPSSDGDGSRWIRALTDWIDAHADHPLALTDLERQTGYSRRSLQLAFRRHMGCTPMQWVKRCRLQKARERLLHSAPGDSVGGVAQRLGFANAASFSRDFTRLYGEKPSALLRQAPSRLDSFPERSAGPAL
ncbi:MAG: hypothetical protein DCF23_07280 [Cyanobium sp.]|nr:MAG: hypothetical protein DCF23_07280 [Cyanobium sp.]